MNAEEPVSLNFADSEANIFELFSLQVEASPSAVAVIDAEGSVTYGELAGQADAVCAHLLQLELRSEQPVAVFMQRRASLLAVLLGIWKAGGAYVPFDPKDPVDRVQRMLLSSNCSLVLGDKSLLDALQSYGVQQFSDEPSVKYVDIKTISLPAKSEVLARCAPGGDRLAYLLFTSGSTGEPKAVEVEHRHALALLRSACNLLRIGAQDRYLAPSTIAFDASITELFLPLVAGASLLLRDRSILLDPRRMARDVREHGVTVVQTGPSVWAVIIGEVPDFPRVRVVITHGEAVSLDLARRLCTYGDEVWNLYGPTETTVWATGCRLSAEGASACLNRSAPGLTSAWAPIGSPLPHVRAYVVDEKGIPVGDGIEGELWLGGSSVARGYHGNEVLTQDRFVEFDGERVYRSGDLVVRDESGVLHYFGRNDDQMKVRGVRVEPGEVEAAILRDSRVGQAAVTWYSTRSGTGSIVAAVVTRPGFTCSAQELSEGLATRLPKPMIPTRFLFVPWLPMTSSGKIDRKAIRQAAEAMIKVDGGNAPVTPGVRGLRITENAVATIWKRVLGIETVAPDDHFFSIGGDSLSAIQMMIEVEERFGLLLPMDLIFVSPALEAFAKAIEQATEQAEDKIERGFVYPMVTQGSGAPLFFNGADLSLARQNRWTVPCPLYAVANWALGAGFVQTKSLTALAAAHLVSIRRIQPQGPYRLGGYSLGGLIAYEMAQQLHDAGETVEWLFLLDPMAPECISVAGLTDSSPAPEPLRRRIKRRIRHIAKGPRVQGWGQWMSWFLPPRIRALGGWFRYLLVHQYLRHPNAALKIIFPRNRWRAFWFAAQRMIKGYTARPYAGPVLAVFCQQGKRGEVWSSLLGANAQQKMFNAPHLALFDEPALSRWMDLLTEYIGSRR